MLMVVGEAVGSAPWWCYVINAVQAVHVSVELLTQRGLMGRGRNVWAPARWLNEISMGSWSRPVRVTAAGLVGVLAWAGVLAGVLALGLPPGTSAAATALTWGGAGLYGLAATRIFGNEITRSLDPSTVRFDAWAHRLFGPFNSALLLGALAFDALARGALDADKAWLAGALALLPALGALERVRVDRVLHAAQLEMEERLAQAKDLTAGADATAAGRLTGVALAQLALLPDGALGVGPGAAGAVAALKNANAIIALVKGEDTSALRAELVADLLRAALQEWPHASAVEAPSGPMDLWRLEPCMRLTRRIVDALADGPDRRMDLVVLLGEDTELECRIDPPATEAETARLAALASEAAEVAGGQLTLVGRPARLVRLTWPGGGEDSGD
jgi:hypothetical protein